MYCKVLEFFDKGIYINALLRKSLSACPHIHFQDFVISFAGVDILCEHLRSYDYYMESISRGSCTLMGYVCHSYQDFLSGKCTECGPANRLCPAFGEDAESYFDNTDE